MGILILYLATSFKNRFVKVLLPSIISILIIAIFYLIPSNAKFQPVKPGEELIYYDEGSTGTVAVLRGKNDYKLLTINGLEEVPLDYVSLQTFRLLGHLPLLLHPNPRDVLVVSFGAGIATGSVAQHPVESITSVELCPEVISAANLFAKENHNVLKNPKVKLIIQDARNYILTTKEKYDVITADATHPSSGDSWILYTKEFYQLCKKRLKKGGIMCQWLPLHWLPPIDYEILLKTFTSVFPHTTLWFVNSYTIMIGTDKELSIDYPLLEYSINNNKLKGDLEEIHMDNPFALLSCFLMGEKTIARFTTDSPINTDDKTYVEFSTSRSVGLSTTNLNLSALLPYRETVYPFLVNIDPENINYVKQKISDYSVSREYILQGRIFHFKGTFEEEIRYYRMALHFNPYDKDALALISEAEIDLKFLYLREGDTQRKEGNYDEAREFYDKAIQIDPHFAQAYNSRGILYFSKGMIREAIKDYEKALEYAPETAEIHYNLALAYLKTGDLRKAQEQLKELSGLMPHHRGIQNILKKME